MKHAMNGAIKRPVYVLRTILLLDVLLSAAQDTAINSAFPAASITDAWGNGGGNLKDGTTTASHASALVDVHSPPSLASKGAEPKPREPRRSSWDGFLHANPALSGMGQTNQLTVNKEVEKVWEKAIKSGPKGNDEEGKIVRGRMGSEKSPNSKVETVDGTTYIIHGAHGGVYPSEKASAPPPPVETHAQKMMNMAHANYDAIAKKDRTFADTLNKEAKQLKAAGMQAEAQVRLVSWTAIRRYYVRCYVSYYYTWAEAKQLNKAAGISAEAVVRLISYTPT